MTREDVQAYLQRPWDEVRQAKEDYWVRERETMSLSDAFALADSMRLSALQLAGDAFLSDRDEDLEELIELKKKLMRAGRAAGRH